MRKNITSEQIEATYNMGKLVYEKKMDLNYVIEQLVKEYNMNPASAKIYVNNFKHFMNGENLEATMNQSAYKYYLSNIEKDYGKEALKTALRAFKIHIDTNKNWRDKKSKNIEAIFNEFSSHCD